MKNGIHVGMFGLGSVGQDVVRLLSEQQNRIVDIIGTPLKITKAVVVNKTKKRRIGTSSIQISDNPDVILSDKNIDLIIEVTGSKSFAEPIINTCLQRSTPIITANKALLAEKFIPILNQLRRSGSLFGYEACVGSGIPFLRYLRDGLVADNITELIGVLNSTSNIVLDLMGRNEYNFSQALTAAYEKKVTESDPFLDVEGYDTAHKICISSAISFHQTLPLEQLPIQGISGLNFLDLKVAENLGYTVKLIGAAEKQTDHLSAWVGPTFVSKRHPLANVNGIRNGLVISAKYTGKSVIQGKGAGSYNAALGVVNDMIQILKTMTTHGGKNGHDFFLSKIQSTGLPFRRGNGKTEYIIRSDRSLLTNKNSLLSNILKKNHIKTTNLAFGRMHDGVFGENSYVATDPCHWQQIESLLKSFSTQNGKNGNLQIFRTLR